MRQCDAVGDFYSELKILWNGMNILLNDIGRGKRDFIFRKKRPEPLIYFDGVVMLGVFFEIVGFGCLGVNDTNPGVVFPGAGADFQIGRVCFHVRDNTNRG